MVKTVKFVVKIAIIFGFLLLTVFGCAARQQKAPEPKPQSKPAVKPKTVDLKAQKQYYDQGVQHYSKEHYVEAKKAFKQVVQISPNNTLGQKAQENLRKIEQILQTLQEIESK